MRSIAAFFWGVIGILVVLGAWVGVTGRALSPQFLETHLLDVVMGTFCLLWLMVILKAPWDLYFRAHEVAFEQSCATERKIGLEPGRAEYVKSLRPRLLVFAIGMHLFSAALIAGITYFSHNAIGLYFAGFYLVSTLFRPALAGYGFLLNKLQAMGEEAYFPRRDVVTLEGKIRVLEETYRLTEERTNTLSEEIFRERHEREEETFALRQTLDTLKREFEVALSRASTQEEVLTGLRALVNFVKMPSSV